MQISNRLSRITPSKTLEIAGKAKALKSQGVDVLDFSVGEPDFDTPEYIKQAAIQAIKDGKTKYTPVPGIYELREAIAEKLREDNDLDYYPDEIIVSTGAKQSLFLALMAILNPGDEVLIPVPYWTSYPDMVLLNGGEPIFVIPEDTKGYRLTKADLERYVTDKTKVLMLTSPSNPSGIAYTLEELKTFRDFAVEHDLYVISDEIYEMLSYEQKAHSIGSLDTQILKRTITVNGFSKAYAMTGWRVGYAATKSKDLYKAMSICQGHMTSNITSISQYAALGALRGAKEHAEDIEYMKNAFAKRRDALIEALEEHGMTYIRPEGAFYVLIDVSSTFGKKYNNEIIHNSTDFANHLLKEKHVALTPGVAFGVDHMIRISYAASLETILEGVKRIAELFSEVES